MAEAAISFDDAPTNQDTLIEIRYLAEEARSCSLALRDLEDQRSRVSQRLQQITRSDLPELLISAGMSSFTLEGKGNLPPVSFKNYTHVQANIAMAWPEDQRSAAFAELARHKAEDLIQVEVTVRFPRGQRQKALACVDMIKAAGLPDPEVKEKVHHGQLTAWVRDLLKRHKPLPDLETIGADVATMTKIQFDE